MPKKARKVMPLTYSFKCQNGHEFDAVAKLRSRCPECQAMTFRKSGNTSSSVPTTTPKSNPGEKSTSSSILSSAAEVLVPDTDIGSKPLASSVQENEDTKSEKSTRPSARIVRQGRVPQPVKPKTSSIVTKKFAPKKIVPSVTGKPTGSMQHKVITPPNGPGSSYGRTMMEKHFGFGKKP
jgi:hypothetical protein